MPVVSTPIVANPSATDSGDRLPPTPVTDTPCRDAGAIRQHGHQGFVLHGLETRVTERASHLPIPEGSPELGGELGVE